MIARGANLDVSEHGCRPTLRHGNYDVVQNWCGTRKVPTRSVETANRSVGATETENHNGETL